MEDGKLVLPTSSAPSLSRFSWKKFSLRPFSGVDGRDRLLGTRLIMLDVLAMVSILNVVKMFYLFLGGSS